MKKVFIALLAIVLISSLILGGCAKTTPAPAPTPAPSPAPSPAPTPAPAPSPTPSPTPTPAAKPITLIFSTHESNKGLYYDRFFKPWIDEIEKRTGGKVKIEAHFNGELAGPPDAWDVLINGSVDISNVHLQNVPDKFPLADVAGFTTYGLVNQRPSYVMWQLYNKYPEMQTELKDVHVMYFGSTYWTSYAGTKQVKTLEDMKGMKTTGTGKWQNKRQEKLGMVPVSMGPMDILPALQTKVVDGGPLGTLLILLDFGWGDFLPHVTHVRTQCIPLLIGMNLKKWNSLPKDVQQALDGMREWTVALHDKTFVDAESELIPVLQEKYKTEFYTPPDEELARWDTLDKPVWDEFATYLESRGRPGREFVADYIAVEKQNSIPLSEWK